jgi:hypothetical protein
MEANHMNRTYVQPMYVMPNEQYFLDNFPPDDLERRFDNTLPKSLISPDKTSKSSGLKTKIPIYSPGKADQHFSAFDKKEDHSRS